jgi:hypothetical protein
MASRLKFTPSAFETNGKLRDARTFDSITFKPFCVTSNCRLKGPAIRSARARVRPISLTCRTRCCSRSSAGNTRVASPEWTPAFSTCSDTAHTTRSPSLATASSSISCASTSNFEITTGWSGESRVARSTYSWSVSADHTTRIAAPDST